MKASEEVSHIYDLSRDGLDKRESRYGDSWKQSGFDVVFAQIVRKVNYLRTQKQNGFIGDDKFREDLLDLMGWCAFAYKHLEMKEE